MTGDCGLHKTKKVQYSSYDSGPRSNLATSLLCTQRKPLVIEKKPAAYFSKTSHISLHLTSPQILWESLFMILIYF